MSPASRSKARPRAASCFKLVRAREPLRGDEPRLALEGEAAGGELLHDARYARVRVLDVVHRILVAARLGELEVEVERLVVAAHEIEEAAGGGPDLLAPLAQWHELRPPPAHPGP